MKSKLMKRLRVMSFVGIGLASILALIWLVRLSSPDRQSFESARTRLLDQARHASLILGSEKAFSYFSGSYQDSRLRDLYAEADAGRRVKRVQFAKPGADYRGVEIHLWQWASTNGVEIILTSSSPQGISIYVRASDEAQIANYLSSLTTDELNPFE
jgi:hypothetical protein